MPYNWLDSTTPRQLRLWPHKSLTPTGFVVFVGITAGLSSLPVLALLGHPAFWVILFAVSSAIMALWYALKRSWWDAQITEDLAIWPDRVTLVRQGPRGLRREWEANPYWIQVLLHPTGGPVPNYITLRGGPREVELGRFLSEDERVQLADELRAALKA